MLLIFPPIAKACEPPAGIAQLAAALHRHGIACRILDANLECQLWLLDQPRVATDTWTRRAVKNLANNLTALRTIDTYGSPDRYARAIRDVNRALFTSIATSTFNGEVIGLADYQHPQLSPLRSADLLSAAEHPEQNPFFQWFQKRLPEVIESNGTRRDETNEPIRVVGFSLNYLSQAVCTFAMIGFVRRRFPGLKIILGGGLITSWMRRPGWQNPFGGLIDSLVAGPGELSLLSLFGVEKVQLDNLTPDYAALPLQDYLSPGLIIPYSAAGGCWWNKCSFCPEQAEGNHYSPVPARQVMDDLNLLVAKNKPVLLHFLDNAISPSLLRALANNSFGVPWYGFARFEQELENLDFCMALKRSGCVMLKIGLESGDQGVLDKLRKGIDIGMAARVLMNLKKAGIAVYLYLLFGTPAETETEAQRTLEFVIRHRESIGFLNLALFNMPICSEESEQYGTKPFYEGDLSLYTAFKHPRGWDRNQVRRFLNNSFKREPAVAAILRNDPPLFTSNHAAFFAGMVGSG